VIWLECPRKSQVFDELGTILARATTFLLPILAETATCLQNGRMPCSPQLHDPFGSSEDKTRLQPTADTSPEPQVIIADAIATFHITTKAEELASHSQQDDDSMQYYGGNPRPFLL